MVMQRWVNSMGEGCEGCAHKDGWGNCITATECTSNCLFMPAEWLMPEQMTLRELIVLVSCAVPFSLIFMLGAYRFCQLFVEWWK